MTQLLEVLQQLLRACVAKHGRRGKNKPFKPPAGGFFDLGAIENR
jgi:hypothetical protein